MFEPITVDGVEYATGSAGSLQLCCPKCGTDRFRHARNYFTHPANWERCYECGTTMEPVKMAEVENKWKPLWSKTDKPKLTSLDEQFQKFGYENANIDNIK